MNASINATLTHDSVSCAGQLLANSPTSAAVMMWQVNIPTAPKRRSLRRPTGSIVHTEVTIPASCRMLRIPDMMSCMS